jgi:hypothetical protein
MIEKYLRGTILRPYLEDYVLKGDFLDKKTSPSVAQID